ncbi:TIGR03943 family putative permease subunit [Paenibacillus cremeus]|uniref:TIGR03943 family protein n=1 Tax=Paenibacillus cremeus TaxID=2163881 RepID=A0A559KE91_9BACL|nr:TIGR03943 family protein [Paenibacillus cremeus]TVY10438.1 TIGR03943 family protein [Paenibacillus cremeus]
MKKLTGAAAHQLLRLVVLLGFTALLGYLLLTGEILMYIVPQLVLYIGLAASGLLVFSGFQIVLFIRSLKQPALGCACGHDHDGHGHSHLPSRSLWKNTLVYGLFLAPLLLSVWLPNQAFAGSLGKSLTAGASTEAPAELVQLKKGTEDPALKQLFKTDKYNRDYATLGMLLYQQDQIEMKDQWFIEKLQALNTFPSHFEGKSIKIKGYIYRDPELKGNQFMIGRLAMTHCIADIAPYGIIAEYPDAASLGNDSWVTLTGTLSQTTYHNQPVIKLMVQGIEPATAPTIPYIYPDWDFAKKL